MARLMKTMATYGVLWTASDVTQELLISRKDHVDWSKTARMSTTGAFVTAPLIYNWLHMVELMFPGSSVKMVLKKIVVDQICFAPIGISTFYLTTSALEGKSGIPELEAKFKKTYLAGLTFWPFVQMLNFRFVPQHYKPIVAACASFVWSIFMCYMKEEDSSKQEQRTSPRAVLPEKFEKDF